MPSEEDIKAQQELLYAYRRTLLALLKQRAQITASFVPPAIATGIDEARDNIRRIKQSLRVMGVLIDDQQNDDEAPLPPLVSIGSLSFGSTNISKSSNIGWYIGAFGLLIALGAVGFVLFPSISHAPSPASPTASNPIAQIPAPSSAPSALPTATPIIKPTVEPTVEPTAKPAAEPTEAPTEKPVPTTAPPPPTAIPPTIAPTPQLFDRQKIEAEDGEVSNGAAITKPEPAASNNAWVNMGANGQIKFTTRALVAGQYKLEIHYDKYANGTSVYPYEGYQDLYVNNSTFPIQIHYTGTHDDSHPSIHFQDTSVPIVLEQGVNTLTIVENVAVSVGGSPDYIILTLIN